MGGIAAKYGLFVVSRSRRLSRDWRSTVPKWTNNEEKHNDEMNEQ
jgi:hypothetical protein